ncbi:Uncharacterized protein FWK35_00029782 [Aphis craccivora]|uniref:Uncharacterized protein n=1 Tax=Aphis craccivora TaxID=307492 RepID=A0A6G0W2A0_APHCR|nr:Uncharacterized protein FWK35_00029782 [Aphis craccivora]
MLFNYKQKPKNKIIIIDFEFSNYQRTDLILISEAISQTRVKTRDFLLKIFEKKPDQLHVILNELHLAMKTKTSNLITNFLKKLS